MFARNRLLWIAALIGLVLDRSTKLLIESTMLLTVPPQTIAVIPGVFHITYVVNTGAAFSLFRQGVGWLRWLSLAVGVGLMVLAWVSPSLSQWEQAGYGCILSGALGNGIDRFVQAQVVDFLELRLIQFPVFNLADVFINIGIGCLLIGAFWQHHPPKHDRDRP
jgi:signal peptidase II